MLCLRNEKVNSFTVILTFSYFDLGFSEASGGIGIEGIVVVVDGATVGRSVGVITFPGASGFFGVGLAGIDALSALASAKAGS